MSPTTGWQFLAGLDVTASCAGPGRAAFACVAHNGTRCAVLAAFTAEMGQEPLGASAESSSADATCDDCTSNATDDPADAGVASGRINLGRRGSALRINVYPGILKPALHGTVVNRASGLKRVVDTASSAASAWHDAHSQIATLDPTARPSRRYLSLRTYQLDRRHLVPRHAQGDAG